MERVTSLVGSGQVAPSPSWERAIDLCATPVSALAAGTSASPTPCQGALGNVLRGARCKSVMLQHPVPPRCSDEPGRRPSESPKRCCVGRRQSCSPPSPSFSVNGKHVFSLNKGSSSKESSPVRLIGFCKRGSVVEPSSGTMEEPVHGNNASSPESPNELGTMLRQTRDIIMGDNHPSTSCEPMAENEFQRFVQEASLRCSTGSHDQFADFVRTNRQAFAQLLRETASRLGGSLTLPPSIGDRDSGVFTDQDGWACPESRPSAKQNGSSSGSPLPGRAVSCTSSSESNLRSTETVTSSVRSSETEPDLRFSSLRERKDLKVPEDLFQDLSAPPGSLDRKRTLLGVESSFQRSPLLDRAHGLSRTAGISDVMSASDTQLRAKPRPFSEFERLTGDVALRSDPEGLNVGGRMSSSFHFSTRSHFEYCGETNTFRFSTQQICESFSGDYESVSESEDEEESLEDPTSLEEESRVPPIEGGKKLEDGLDTSSVCSLSSAAPSIVSAKRSDNTAVGASGSGWGRVAQELLSTEETYVTVLHLLDQVFAFRVDQENRAHPMFPQAVVSAMFSNLKSLYQLHHDFLLPKLKDRINSWESNPCIGDIMKGFAPFLKMYTEYVKNYDDAMRLLGSWCNKQPRFAAIMDDIHRMPECGNLTIQHHMLTPVQRVPRYQLLLKEYLKKLPEDSRDRGDTEKALELVSTAAHHSNEAMKKIDKFKKLLEVQELVGGVMDLVSPTRELLLEGKITKICAKSADHQERHMFVFNDLVLLCSQRLMSNRVVSGACYRVRARVDVDGLIVQEGDNLETPNSFYIKNTGRSIELYAQSPEEKMTWMQTLAKAVHDLKLRKSSLKIGLNGTKSPEDLELGQRAPVLVKAETVSHCQRCSMAFSALGLRWKHHCHACGIVACSKCLSQKAKLAYDNNRASRVCSSCWTAILQSHPEKADSDKEVRSPLDSPVLQPEAAIVSGYLKLKTGRRGTSWARRWFALHRDFVLYSFKSDGDFLPLTSMPVPGFLVGLAEKGDGVDLKFPVFKLYHQKKTYFFQTSDVEELERWISALDKASRAEDPG